MEVTKILQKKKKQLLEMWMNNQIADTMLREDLISNDDLRTDCEELVNVLSEHLDESAIKNHNAKSLDPVYEILSGISISRARRGFTPAETGLFVLSLKNALFELLKQEIKNDPADLYTKTIDINNLMDDFSIKAFETYIKGREEVILRQTDEIADISTPVIRIWDGILALPIIGTLDSSRTQIVMENLLQEIVDTGSTIAILDISGVPAVDSLVAQHLIKTVSATRLMGAECIISGIRPEIAQTVVHLGIDLTNIITKGTLASALKTAFSMMQLEVKKVSNKLQ